MLKSQTVQLAFQLFLGRFVEKVEGLENHQKFGDLDELRAHMVSSAEFRNKIGNWTQYVPAQIPALDREVTVFQHIPKCGGTSFHNILADYAKEKGLKICSERHNGLLNWPMTHLLESQIFSGHYDASTIDLIPGQKKTVTFLRDPVERLISLYRFLRGHPEVTIRGIQPHNMELASLARQFDMLDFFSLPELQVHPSIDNGMVRQLSGHLPIKRWEAHFGEGSYPKALFDQDPEQAVAVALQRLSEMTAYGFVEDMHASVTHILDALNIPYPEKIVHVNVSENRGSGRGPKAFSYIIRDPMTDELSKVLQKITRYDQMLYSEAKSRCDFLTRGA